MALQSMVIWGVAREMKGLPTAAAPPVPRHRLIPALAARPALAVTLFILVLTVILLAVMQGPLSPDISGQLWIADRLRHGARLYIDISEINPPLWFWLAIPVDGLAAALGVRAEAVLIVAIGFAALLSLLATNQLLKTYPPELRSALLIFAACILLIMPLRDLGQREQIALMGALPYVALIVARREGRRVPLWLALVVASGAAVGFALKHYFIGVPLLLELWLLFCLRRQWRPVRPETVMLLTGAISYVLAIVTVTPGYLQVSVPELLLGYGASGAPSLNYMIRPAQPIWVLILCAIVLQRSVTAQPLAPMTVAFLIAALGFFLAWLIQHKGWPYQSIATTGFLALAMAMTLVDASRQAFTRPRMIAVAALILPMLLCAVPTQWVPTPETDIAPALVGLEPGDTVAIISIEGRTAWPATVGRGLRFSGRRGAFWIFAAVDANALGRHDPRIEALGRKIVREAVQDYRCLPPKHLIFTPGRASSSVTSASDNPLGYFQRDPQFVELLSHYRRLDRRGDFDAFQLVRPFDPMPVDMCLRAS